MESKNFPKCYGQDLKCFAKVDGVKPGYVARNHAGFEVGVFLDRKKGDMFLKLSFLRKGKSVNGI